MHNALQAAKTMPLTSSGESAGNSCENGSLSPVAGRGTGSTGSSRRTRHFRPRGKCREFRRERFTFPRERLGHRLHRPLSPHLPFPPSGKVPGFSAKTVHFPPWLAGVSAPQALLAALGVSQGHRLHRLFSPHPPFPPSGKVPGISAKTVHFPPRHETSGEVQQGMLLEMPSIQAL